MPGDIRSFHTWAPQWHELPAGSWLGVGAAPGVSTGVPCRPGPRCLPCPRPKGPFASSGSAASPVPRAAAPAGFRPQGCCQLCACVSALHNLSLTGSTVYPRCSESSLRSPAAQRDHQNQGQLPELQRDASSRRHGPLGCARAVGPECRAAIKGAGAVYPNMKGEIVPRPRPQAPGAPAGRPWAALCHAGCLKDIVQTNPVRTVPRCSDAF